MRYYMPYPTGPGAEKPPLFALLLSPELWNVIAGISGFDDS